MDINELSANDCIERISQLLSRSLLMPTFKENEPLPCLAKYTSALIDGDIASAQRRYHELCTSLLNNDARRVSGDLFTDYLMHLILVNDEFYKLIKHRRLSARKDSLARAMRHELRIFSELRGISSPLLYRLIRERARETQLKNGKDDIAIMSSAVWAGEAVQKPAADKAKKSLYTGRLVPEVEFFSFRYGDVELRDEYAADEALEEMYFRLLETKDWSNLYDSISEMRLAYGSGDFMRYRRFFFCGDRLMAMDKLDANGLPVQVERCLPFYDNVRESIMDNVISFMRGGEYNDMILLGAPASGKTALMLTIPEELSELRFVLVDGDGYKHIKALEYLLSQQPYRFLVVLDRLAFAEINEKFEVSMLLDRIGRGSMPRNAIFIATSRYMPDCVSSFEPVRMPGISQSDFIDIVAQMRDNKAADDESYPRFTREDIINACLDLRIDLGADTLNLFLAKRVLKKCVKNIN